MPNNEAIKVLVTGATGRIGRHVVDELKAHGFKIRAVTSQPLSAEQKAATDIEWRQHDFAKSSDVDALVEGCHAIQHLAANLWDIPKMPMANVEATRALGEAANTYGVRFFGFTSSITVYGSAKSKDVNENTPLLTGDRDVAEEYRGNPSIRAYGRSKVLGERVLAAAASNVECVIFRPTVVVDLPIMVGIAQRNFPKQFVLGSRHEHHIYVKDVAHALVWFMQRSLDRTTPKPGVEIFNLADDAASAVTGAAIAARAKALTGSPKFRSTLGGPVFAYNLIDMLTNRRFSLRYPLGMMVYSNKKLMDAGYRFKYGLDEAQRLAFAPFASK